MKKAQKLAVEDALADIETYLVRCTDRHRSQLRRTLNKLVRRCLKAEAVSHV